ncbi:MAG: hypothetical protein MMC33_004856 [Icmadophila ericetorum]|nr:hypothetical protein [Icmadophila ericetorum]
MGKRGKKFRGGGREGGNRGREGGGRRPERATYTEIPKENELYEFYYNELEIVSEAERDKFWTALRRDLPNSFRFTGSKGHALAVQQRLIDRYIPQITSITHEGELVEPPTPLPWYPDQLAWQMTTPKNVVRRFAPFASFQKFLVSETSVGNLSRQEVVSMIPPLLMDIKPGMTVLDMCAAPGSKSAQLIEMVHAGEEDRMSKVQRQIKKGESRSVSPESDAVSSEPGNGEIGGDWLDDGRTTGLLIANDSDYKRAHLLIHQMKRLNSPNLIVTNHDATMYPSIKLPSDPSAPNKGVSILKFDRILADVPCSGDGTARKNINVWKDWNPGNSLGLYPTQVRILVRALQMLKPGGRVVYSTCSMNPVENEAVVASAIQQFGGMSKVRLIDCSDQLPELRRCPGLHSWKVMDKGGNVWTSWTNVEKQKEEDGPDGLGKLVRNMFPPLMNGGDSDIPLERCMRIYPHDQDTGGFFIAVIEKLSELKLRVQKLESKAPAPGVIGSIVSAIESMPTDTTNPIEKIDALDELAPPQVDLEMENPSAAARQNQENITPGFVSSRKRELDVVADAVASVKRPKFREEIDAVAEEGEEDRLVHYPPPPAAQTDPKIIDALTKPAAPTPSSNSAPTRNKKTNHSQVFEEPFKYLSPTHEDLHTISKFYALHPRFPMNRFMVRNATGTPSKTIYYTSHLAKDILTENEGRGVKFVHCGVKMFVKQDVQGVGVCKWRIQGDGLPILEGWVGEERSVYLRSRRTFKSLLVEMFPKVNDGGWMELGEIGERVRDISMGCCVLRVINTEGEDGIRPYQLTGSVPSEHLTLPLWRSLHSLNLMLPKEERSAMLLRMYDYTEPLKDSSKNRFNKTNREAPNGEKDGKGEVNGENEEDGEEEEAFESVDEGEDVGVAIGTINATVETNTDDVAVVEETIARAAGVRTVEDGG